MKQFMSTRLFHTLQEASQSGIDRDVQILKTEYEEFVTLLLSKNTTLTDRVIYYNKLVYVRVELRCLTYGIEKKMQQFIGIRRSC